MIPDETLEPYLAAYAGYACDEAIRNGASSGGFATAFLSYLLRQHIIDAALVSQTYIEEGQLKARSFLARSPQDLLSSQTSIYMTFPYLQGLNAILNEDSRIAIIGLPCQLEMVRRWEKRHPDVKGRIVIRLGLFCSKGASPHLIQAFFERHNLNPQTFKRFAFRRHQWHAHVYWEDQQGQSHTLPYMNYAFYNNLYIQQPRQCLACPDATATEADISCGDAWLPRIKKQGVSQSLVILRNRAAADHFNDFVQSGAFTAESLTRQEVISAQRRNLIKKCYFPKASQRLGFLFGYTVKPKGGLKPRWNHYFGAALVMLSMRVGDSPKRTQFILRLPRWVLYPYMAVLKAFMSF